jgi:ankyrin repeat protein
LGWTALHISAIHNDIKSVKLLVKKGADVTKKDLQLKTALDYARKFFCIEVAHYLSKMSPAMK